MLRVNTEGRFLPRFKNRGLAPPNVSFRLASAASGSRQPASLGQPPQSRVARQNASAPGREEDFQARKAPEKARLAQAAARSPARINSRRSSGRFIFGVIGILLGAAFASRKSGPFSAADPGRRSAETRPRRGRGRRCPDRTRPARRRRRRGPRADRRL